MKPYRIKLLARYSTGKSEWRNRALCSKPEYRGLPWFPSEDTPSERRNHDRKVLNKICASCPVQAECRDYAEKAHINAGIWAGKNYGKMEAGERWQPE